MRERSCYLTSCNFNLMRLRIVLRLTVEFLFRSFLLHDTAAGG
jgi:hypothetical protein